jgi:hypothetical protein
VWAAKDYVVGKFGRSAADFDKMMGVKDDFDYVP